MAEMILKVAVECPIEGCRPTLDIEFVTTGTTRGPGGVATVTLAPASGAIEKAVLAHVAETHGEAETDKNEDRD